MTRAFVLGAGLGTRLRPLTHQLPKPLIPVHQRPLAEYAFEHLRGAGVREFVVNTHHLPGAWETAFPGGSWQGGALHYRHEPVLLETGGGLANVQDLLADDGPFFMYNGDIYTEAPLSPALTQHRADGNLVTLLLRSTGPVRNVAMDTASRRVLDLRNARGTNHADQFQFTGICIIEPDFFKYLPARGTIESVVAAWLRALDAGERIGGALADGGLWLDLGDRASYLEAHRVIPCAAPIHASARIGAGVEIDSATSIGADCVVEAGAVLEQCILWPGARVAPGARLTRCVVMSGHTAEGSLVDADV